MKNIWEAMSMQARAGLMIGLVLILVIVGATARWALAKDYEVLFADLNQQDASAMAAELDRLKQPYELAQNGTAILVPADSVARTRLKLVAKNLPAHGGVGFEIFNDVDYGMTEFAQKVNYQRALQGELTRTILALDEIQSARVHLVMPDAGLFKREDNRAKASVTLAVKAGRSLDKAQVGGIQRLVSAAVADMDPRDVTVLNALGEALSALPSQQSADSSDWKLEAKRQVEAYLTHKLDALIDKAVGPGQGSATVDAELNLDNVKVTAEEVLPGSGSTPQDAISGVMVHERVSTRAPSGASAPGDSANADATVTNSDTEYAVGRRVQQVVSTPGTVKRVNVGVVLPPDVSAAQIEQLRELIGAAVGLDKGRGDTVAFYAKAAASAALNDGHAPMPTASTDSPGKDDAVQIAQAPRQDAAYRAWPVAAAALALLAIFAVAWHMVRTSKAAPWSPRPTPDIGDQPAPLTDAQRQRLLAELRAWLVESKSAAS
jgi:flagellar M-ring protein FliF